MKILKIVSEEEVMSHWKDVENHTKNDFRNDIRSELPKDIVWLLCEFEKKDIEQFYIISSKDWSSITDTTFKIKSVVNNLNNNNDTDDNFNRIKKDINNKIEYIKSGNVLDTKLISITNCPYLNGPFTLIEGNRRSIALLHLNMLGKNIKTYVGYSSSVSKCKWTRFSYKEF